MTIQEMKIGDHASVTKTVSETDVYLFAGITGDLNPAHTNEVAASKTMFRQESHTVCWVQVLFLQYLACTCRVREQSTWVRS